MELFKRELEKRLFRHFSGLRSQVQTATVE